MHIQSTEFHSEEKIGREAGLGRGRAWASSPAGATRSATPRTTASFAHPLPRQYTGAKASEINFLYSWPDINIHWPEAGKLVPASLLDTPSGPSGQATGSASSIPSCYVLAKAPRTLFGTQLKTGQRFAFFQLGHSTEGIKFGCLGHTVKLFDLLKQLRCCNSLALI